MNFNAFICQNCCTMFSNTGYSGVRNNCSKKSKRIYLWPFFVFHWYNREHTVQGILLFFGNDGRGTEVLVRQLSDAGANKSSTADHASDQNLFSAKQVWLRIFFSFFSLFLPFLFFTFYIFLCIFFFLFLERCAPREMGMTEKSDHDMIWQTGAQGEK